MHSRHPLLRQPVGEFQLHTSTDTYPLKVIKDISSSGIRFYLDSSLTARMQVTVEYVESNRKLEVNGIVAWCAERLRATDDGDDRGRFIIGVRLLSPMLLMAMSGTY
jgi:hypothetical protein